MAPKKRSIAVLVYATLLLQVLGYSFKALAEGTAFANFLFLYSPLAEQTTILINEAYIGFMMLALFATFFRWSSWPFFVLGTLFLGESVFRSLLGGDLAASMALPAECVRYLWLLVMGYALRLERTLDVETSMPSVRLFLRFGLAMTFATHGIEALLQLPNFIDLIIVANRKLLPFPDSELFARNVLIGIGLLDLLLALLVFIRPTRAVLVYMAFWGFITAYSRVLLTPEQGWFDAFLRAPHYGLPLIIMSIEGQKSLSPRRMYYKLLKSIRAQKRLRILGQ